jgi:hypothetical protein
MPAFIKQIIPRYVEPQAIRSGTCRYNMYGYSTTTGGGDVSDRDGRRNNQQKGGWKTKLQLWLISLARPKSWHSRREGRTWPAQSQDPLGHPNTNDKTSKHLLQESSGCYCHLPSLDILLCKCGGSISLDQPKVIVKGNLPQNSHMTHQKWLSSFINSCTKSCESKYVKTDVTTVYRILCALFRHLSSISSANRCQKLAVHFIFL